MISDRSSGDETGALAVFCFTSWIRCTSDGLALLLFHLVVAAIPAGRTGCWWCDPSATFSLDDVYPGVGFRSTIVAAFRAGRLLFSVFIHRPSHPTTG